MNVLIIPEDFRKDQYLLGPLFTAVLTYCGRPRAKVRICNPPLLQGVTEALKSSRLKEIVDRYSFVDLFILCVDRDGVLGRQVRLNQIEAEFSEKHSFLAVNAWEELETWTLAGLPLPKDWVWAEVRADISVKENYFDELAAILEVDDGPGGGRKQLGIQAAKNLPVILSKCPEDFGVIVDRVCQFVAAN